MFRHGLMIPLVLAAMVMVSFWRQLLLLLLSLVLVVFCLGLYLLVEIMHH